MTGIIGAMDIEVDGIKAELTDREVKTIAGLDFCRGKLNGADVVVARCNPGKVNAAACAQIMALEYSPELIINPGVAGGIGEGIKLGDLVIGTSCIQHDMDTSALGDEVGFISGINIKELPCDRAVSEKIRDFAEPLYEGRVHSGIIVTGDRFIGDSETGKMLREKFGAVACEMESGAIAHVCYMNSIPFVALRSISDNGDDGAAVDYMSFCRSAAEKTIKLMNSCIGKI